MENKNCMGVPGKYARGTLEQTFKKLTFCIFDSISVNRGCGRVNMSSVQWSAFKIRKQNLASSVFLTLHPRPEVGSTKISAMLWNRSARKRSQGKIPVFSQIHPSSNTFCLVYNRQFSVTNLTNCSCVCFVLWRWYKQCLYKWRHFNGKSVSV